MNIHFGEKGFTLFEFLIVFVIIAVLAGIGILSFLLPRERAEVNRTTDELLATLNLARSRTTTSQDLSSWGVHLEASRFVLFRGTTYDAGNPSNEITNLNTRVELRNITLNGGGQDVIFLRPGGNTNTFGTVTVASKNTNESRLIRIEEQGLISKDTGVPSSPLNPNADTRHVHLTLGWSIRNSTTLTLTFQNPPNPNVVENIAMAPYFNADKTHFDWDGAVSVGGDIQKLRIHTHSLTASNTILSITRDRRFNDKAVIIAIDAQEIVRYVADGTVTVGPFGGILEIQ